MLGTHLYQDAHVAPYCVRDGYGRLTRIRILEFGLLCAQEHQTSELREEKVCMFNQRSDILWRSVTDARDMMTPTSLVVHFRSTLQLSQVNAVRSLRQSRYTIL
jgi:hypothetical protein